MERKHELPVLIRAMRKKVEGTAERIGSTGSATDRSFIEELQKQIDTLLGLINELNSINPN